MLWDVDIYLVLIGSVLLLTGIIVASIVWVVTRRIIRGLYYQRLDSARDQYRPRLNSIIEGTFKGELDSLRRPPRTIEWQAIEDLLLKFMDQVSQEQQRKLTEVFERLSYVDFYLLELKVDIRWRRAVAAQRLGMIRSSRAVPGLLKVLEDKDQDVRQAAMVALGQIRDPQALEMLVNKLREVIDPYKGLSSRLLVATLVPYGEAAVPLLMNKLSDPLDAVRALAAEILGGIPNLRALQVLIRSLKDPSPEVRAKAAYALGQIGHPLAVKPLIAALSDPFWYVRLQAAKSLGRLGSPRSIYDLSLRLNDSHAQIRSAASEAMIEIGPLALQALTTQLLYTADRYAREQLSQVVQRYGLVDQWIENLDTTDDWLYQHVQGLLMAAAQGGSLNSMLNALQSHPRPQIRMKLIDILGKAGRQAAIKAIHRVSLHDSDPVIRERARQVILKAKRNGKVINSFG